MDLAEAYRQVASDLGCGCFDAETVISVSAFGGVHLDTDQHEKLAQVLVKIVQEIIIDQSGLG